MALVARHGTHFPSCRTDGNSAWPRARDDGVDRATWWPDTSLPRVDAARLRVVGYRPKTDKNLRE